MLFPQLVAGILGLLSLLVAYALWPGPVIRRHGKPLRRPPNTLPFAGNGILFLQARHILFSWFVRCERLFGRETFEISVPTLPPGVVINDPRNLEYVLKNEGLFAKGDFFKRRSWDLFGNGIINADGALWKVQRKAGLHFLSNANLNVFATVALPRFLAQTVRTLHESSSEGGTCDLEAVFQELMTQLMGRMAYDMEMHSQDDFSAAFEYASGATGKRFQNPLWQLTEIFWGSQLRAAVKTVRAFGSDIVATAIETRKAGVACDQDNKSSLFSTSGTLVNSLLDSIEDEKIVADAALNYLSAGKDTASQALTWGFYLLMRHPDVVQEVRREAEHVSRDVSPVGSDLDSAVFRPSALPYTMAVFYETLRLYPPIPFELKQCEASTTLPDGTYLPKSSVLLWCTWAMNRSYLSWGADADAFRPARWLDGDGALVPRPAHEFPVFNGGPRTCLGKKMAEMIVVQVIATLALRFDFNLLDDTERISKNSLTLPMEGGLPCRVRARE